MSKICLFGASGHGKVVKDAVLSTGTTVEVFFDDAPKSEMLHSTPILPSSKLEAYKDNDFLISIGNNKIRKKISKELNVSFAKIIHNTAILSETVTIDEGTVVMAGTSINADSKIGKHAIINTNAVVEHDCIIADFAHISPNATVTGNVTIGEGTHIGAGATIIPNITIGKWATIGAGAVIINDIPDYAVVVGNPGKIKKYNTQ